MTPTREQIRALCDAATEGEWHVINTATAYSIRCNNKTSWNSIAHINKKLRKPSEANARFIAASRTIIPHLLDEVEWLEKQLNQALGENNE